MNTFTKSIGVVVLSSLAVAGCKGANTNTVTADGTAAAASATSTMGLSDALVQTAVQAAKGWLSNKMGSGQSAMATAQDKASAAQAGVDAATATAQQDGTTITDQQKTGLLSMLKGML